MTQSDYIGKVLKLKRTLDGGSIVNTIQIRPYGLIGTVAYGEIQRRGFALKIAIENLDFYVDGSVRRSFRYRIFGPGQVEGVDQPLIRLQSDKRLHPNNAHFGPNWLFAHYEEHLWPAWLQNPDLTKAYELFSRIVSDNGILPEPFKSA